ncbi:kinase-like protein [Lentinula detonsa]|uniref:Kinase-like protein n=1 Tax=Lentinula detonsa TaxID=2804962 RepID=A0AA38URI1_9AGAR|nr:kinase-like protein [Lentinula detonsa]
MIVALLLRAYLRTRKLFDNKRRYGRIKDLPFGLILKIGTSTTAAEATTVNFIRSNTTIPVPRVVASDRAFGNTYMLMREVKGRDLQDMWPQLDHNQRTKVVAQLRSYVAQLRALSPSLSRGHQAGAVCGLHYTSTRDSRIASVTPTGPFPNESAFNDHLILAAEPYMDETTLPAIRARMRDDHRICFTHGDLAPRNIFVEGDTVTAIIDWEESGWYPEYWETVKGMWSTIKDPEWHEAVRFIMGGDFEADWRLDRELSNHMVGAF